MHPPPQKCANWSAIFFRTIPNPQVTPLRFLVAPVNSTGSTFTFLGRRGDQAGGFPAVGRSPVGMVPVAAIALLVATLDGQLRRFRR